MEDTRQRIPEADPTSAQMVERLLNLGNMTILERDFVNHISQILDKKMGLWFQEKHNLQRIYDLRTQ